MKYTAFTTFMALSVDNIQEEEEHPKLRRLDLAMRVVKLMHSDEDYEDAMEELQIWLETKLERKLTPAELIDMLEALQVCVESEPDSAERINSISYLLSAKFLKEETI